MKQIRYEHPTFSDFDRLFNWSLQAASQALQTAAGSRTPVSDVQEDEQHFTLKLELPGIKKDDLELSLDKAVLTVSAKSKSEDGTKHTVSFTRSFTLSESIQQDKIAATLEDGVLSVTLPKAEVAKPRQIKIK